MSQNQKLVKWDISGRMKVGLPGKLRLQDAVLFVRARAYARPPRDHLRDTLKEYEELNHEPFHQPHFASRDGYCRYPDCDRASRARCRRVVRIHPGVARLSYSGRDTRRSTR